MLIREGAIEGETHISEKGRKFVMVRRDNLDSVKNHVFDQIDMTTAGKLLGFQKRRMRQLLQLVFRDATKLGSSPGAPWAVSRIEVNKLIDIGLAVEAVSIVDEGCVSMAHILRYWTWTSEDIAGLLLSVKSQEINLVNRVDSLEGVAGWSFNEAELKNWKLKNQSGLGTWLTITQASKVMGIKEQVAYELVRLGYLKSEVMPKQMKKGTRIRRKTVEAFNQEYIFATKIAEHLGCSPRKAINNLEKMYIMPISGPRVDGMRQVLYLRTQEIESTLQNHQKINDLLSDVDLRIELEV